ncbi:MAG TPA: diacylglycerol kinase family protein [Candidatus Saccharimonadales bacterium]|nr:diacylglycerol kinase family protein [Candidatus Saccharimonadales bacterium]
MGLFKSFYYAIIGISYVFKNERNARIHFLMAILALGLGVALGVSSAELAAIFFAVIIVFVAEIINTAIEKTLDLIDTKRNPQVAIIKDMVAGAVLVAAGGALIIGVVIFWPYVLDLAWRYR